MSYELLKLARKQFVCKEKRKHLGKKGSSQGQFISQLLAENGNGSRTQLTKAFHGYDESLVGC